MITCSHFARYSTGRKITMKIFILLSAVVAAFASQQCGENEHFESCGTACPLTCDNYKNPPQACVLSCDIGCQCDEGFVRSSDGRCVRPVQCPQRDEQCGENEHFESCGTACPLTCDNYKNPPQFCVKMCGIGCHCDEGFVRSTDGRCVRPVQCPLRDQQCGENEHFESCGTACPLTCDNYKNPPKACVLRCDIGCQCDEGFVRSFEGRCVRPVQCPQPVQPLCGENQRFSQCASPCPLTCDNYANPPKICPAMCLLDTCECEQGYVKTRDGRCVRPEQCANSAKPTLKTCLEKPDPGMCQAYIPSWYFDTKTGKCEQFIYGGCQGNGNRYASEGECLGNCRAEEQSSPDACDFPSDEGVCRGSFLRFYFDRTTGLCQKFIYGGCGGNENNFETVEQCKNTCAGAAPTACQEEKVVGPCKAHFIRYYFNKESGKCEEFAYGGCLGNSNNFHTEEECQDVCSA